MVKGTHPSSVKDDGGAVGTGTSRRATAPRRRPPHGMGTRRRQSPSAIALFLQRARRVHNATSRCNRLGSVVLTLGELRRITKDFSKDQLVGKGAFGKVYKGILTNGDIIAVKRFASTITGLQDIQYENEAQHLMMLRHPNIVQLVGCCSETKMEQVMYNGKFVHAEKPERLLCLEYMPKGSLRGYLSDESSGLDWNTRYKIIEGICYGLHYLHEEWQATPIIHMDLKPGNILLDDNMVPKIADFGLSRLFGEDQTRTCTRSCKGTTGYMAPEYIEKGVITKKFDIFSLGVIIIEIITGLKDYPRDETETASHQYIDLVLHNWRNRLREAQGYTTQDIYYQQIQKCIQIGLLCVKFDRLKRPTIIQIIKMLERSDEAYKNEREVSEEVENAMFRQFSARAAPHTNKSSSIQQKLLVDRNQHPRYQLIFLNNPIFVYTMMKVESDDGTALKVAVVERLENNRTKTVRYGPLSSSGVKVVLLHGNFNATNEESWSPEEFKKHIISGQERSAQFLAGNLELKLNGGKVILDNVFFTNNSSFTSTEMFRLGVSLENSVGEIVLEGVTKPFCVKDHREERYEKYFPAMLDDEVWRLKNISKFGPYYKALARNGIHWVQTFLQAYMKDEQKLKKIFNKMPKSTWKPIIEHAMTCRVGDSLYLYEVQDKGAGLFFDEIHRLVGAKFGDCYKPIDQLNEIEKNLVEVLKQEAYQNIDGLLPHYKMVNDYPVLCSFPALHPNQ